MCLPDSKTLQYFSSNCDYVHIYIYTYTCVCIHPSKCRHTHIHRERLFQNENIYLLWVVRLRVGWICLFACLLYFHKCTFMLFCFYSNRVLLLTQFWRCSFKMESKQCHSLNGGKRVSKLLSVWGLNSSHVISDPYCKLARMFPSRK